MLWHAKLNGTLVSVEPYRGTEECGPLAQAEFVLTVTGNSTTVSLSNGTSLVCVEQLNALGLNTSVTRKGIVIPQTGKRHSLMFALRLILSIVFLFEYLNDRTISVFN